VAELKIVNFTSSASSGTASAFPHQKAATETLLAQQVVAKTKATMASTIGTARAARRGRDDPWQNRVVPLPSGVEWFVVPCGSFWAVGLRPPAKRISSPHCDPPLYPPEFWCRAAGFPSPVAGRPSLWLAPFQQGCH